MTLIWQTFLPVCEVLKSGSIYLLCYQGASMFYYQTSCMNVSDVEAEESAQLRYGSVHAGVSQILAEHHFISLGVRREQLQYPCSCGSIISIVPVFLMIQLLNKKFSMSTNRLNRIIAYMCYKWGYGEWMFILTKHQ